MKYPYAILVLMILLAGCSTPLTTHEEGAGIGTLAGGASVGPMAVPWAPREWKISSEIKTSSRVAGEQAIEIPMAARNLSVMKMREVVMSKLCETTGTTQP